LTGALSIALLSVLVALVPWQAAAPRSATRVSADLGVDATLDTSRGANIALSPDGSTLAFIAAKGRPHKSMSGGSIKCRLWHCQVRKALRAHFFRPTAAGSVLSRTAS
jgi:hypothetical protein